jgi:flagellar protein FliS
MAKDFYLESRVLTADAVELIHILYEHVLTQVKAAGAALAVGDIGARARAIGKALEALGELEGSLDHKAGGVISQNLAQLYQYMRKRLLDASLKRDGAALVEVESLIRTLDEGWTAMRHAASIPAAAPYLGAGVESTAQCWSA